MTATLDPLAAKIPLSSYTPSVLPQTTQTQPTLSRQNNPLTNPFGGMQTSTPNQSQNGTFNMIGQTLGTIGRALSNIQNESAYSGNTPKIAPTQSGGVIFHPSMANGFNTPVTSSSQLPSAQLGNLSNTNTGGLEQYINNQYQTPNGGTVTTTGGAGGNITGFTPSNRFNIDTSGSIPSSALGSTVGSNDINQQHSQYMDYVNGLAQAQGYSPEYIQALQAQQQAQAQGATLQANSAALNSNLYTGNNLPGDTMNYAQGATAKAQAQNTLQQSQNSIQQLSANQQMQVQALIRSGNIAAATALVQAAQPVGVSPGTSLVSPLNGQEQYNGLGGLIGVNALNQANSLQSQFPDANIPSFDPSTMTPQEWQQNAMKAVQSAPSFQSHTPEGQADIASLVTQQGALDQVQYSFNKANNTLTNVLVPFMHQYGINNSNIPAINQLTNNLKARGLDPQTSAGVISAFKADVQELASDYSQVISRGGTRSVETDETSKALLDPNIKPSDIQLIGSQLQANGKQAVNDLQGQVNIIKGRLGGKTNSNSNPSGGSSQWPGWNPQ